MDTNELKQDSRLRQLDGYLVKCLDEEKNLHVVLSLAKDKLYAFPFDKVPIHWIVLHTVCSILLVLSGDEPIDTLDVAVMVAGHSISSIQRHFVDSLYSQHQPQLPDEDFALVDESLFPGCRSTAVESSISGGQSPDPRISVSQRNGGKRILLENSGGKPVGLGSDRKRRKLSDGPPSYTQPEGQKSVIEASEEALDQKTSEANSNTLRSEGKGSDELTSIEQSEHFTSPNLLRATGKDADKTSGCDITRSGTTLFASFSGKKTPPPKVASTIPQCSDTGIELLASFQRNLDVKAEPTVFRGLISDWPACKLWNSSKYLLKRTRGGQSLVPVEIGYSYTSEGWTQQLMSFKRYLYDYILSEPSETGYLAQYNLFNQYTELKQDFVVPDICCLGEDDNPPIVNAWLGPKNTVSPLHTDPHHNVFCQVVGYKHIRLYSPSQTPNMHPRGIENGIDMSNTSQVNLESNQRDKFPNFPWDSNYLETTVGPGDALFIPKGWWHHVQSLSSSISISFWF